MPRPLVVLAIISLLAAAPLQAKLYKWVDEAGNVHYSDKVPPQAADREREVKSEETGITVDRVEAPPSRAELEAEARRQREAAARREAERRQAEQDRILLLTFSSVGEMERARDDRVTALESQARLTESRIGKLQAQLEQEKQRAAQAERAGRSPQPHHQRIAGLERQIADLRQFIASNRAEQAEIRARFARDIARYKELKAND